MSRKTYTKPCRDCDEEIALARRAVGHGFDALELEGLSESERARPHVRVHVGGFSWEPAQLFEAVAQELDVSTDAARWSVVSGQWFDWRQRHHCIRRPKAAVA